MRKHEEEVYLICYNSILQGQKSGERKKLLKQAGFITLSVSLQQTKYKIQGKPLNKLESH